jgi:hypothetical protein
MSEASEQLEVLRGAEVFVFWAEGFMSRVGPELAAFRALRPLAAEHVPSLKALFGQATPAGRIYFCCLLDDRDPAAARAAWTELSASTGRVLIHPGGCTPRIPSELGAFARDALEHGVQAALQRALHRYVAALPPGL